MRFQAVRSIGLAILALTATAALALDAKYTEWGRGPAQYFMTRDEVARWKAIRSDADAERFVALFWARRDPTPDTPANEFRDRFETLVRYADDKLSGPRNKKGSLTDRGRVLLLFGPPDRVQRQQRPVAAQTLPPQAENVIIWTYEGEIARDLFDLPRVEIVFVQRAGNDGVLERGGAELFAATHRVHQKQITQPGLTEPRNFSAVAAPSAVAPQKTTELSSGLRAAVDAFRGDGRSPHQIFATWGEYVTPNGTVFVPVSLYVPRASGITTARELTFFGHITDAAGKQVAAIEFPARLSPSNDDYFVDHSLTELPAGKHHAVFGLADGGAPVALTSVEMELSGTLDPAAAATSPLLLSNNIYPLTSAQGSTDPFAFGGVKVVPKGDRTFRTADELWYFVELRNPGLNEAGEPRVQVKIDVAGTDAAGNKVRVVAPPREVEAPEMKGVPRHHGIGNAVPLSTFKPGEYTFTIKVTDTVRKSSYTLKEQFRIVR